MHFQSLWLRFEPHVARIWVTKLINLTSIIMAESALPYNYGKIEIEGHLTGKHPLIFQFSPILSGDWSAFWKYLGELMKPSLSGNDARTLEGTVCSHTLFTMLSKRFYGVLMHELCNSRLKIDQNKFHDFFSHFISFTNTSWQTRS